MALKAFAKLRTELPSAEYWIIGDGPERPHLERVVRALDCEDSVRFLGWRSRDELLSLLGDLDVVVHPSLHEQFCYALLEAMAAGRPVISLAAGGPRHLVDESCGYPIEIGEPTQVEEEIYLALQQLAADRDDRIQRGARARAKAISCWNWREVARRIDGFYRDILES